jgi:hypothetical protein
MTEIEMLDNALSDILEMLKAKNYARAKLLARLALERKLSPNPFNLQLRAAENSSDRRVKQIKMQTCPVCGASYASAIICSDDTIVPLNATCFICKDHKTESP